MEHEFDLWGDPVLPRAERRGRPAHEATDEKRKRVKALRAMNKNVAEIAAAMGLDRATVRKYYSPELRGGLEQLRAEILVVLTAKAREGNVSAIREFLRQTEKSDLSGVRSIRPPRLGKKAQARIDAGRPDTGTTMGDLMAERAEPSVH